MPRPGLILLGAALALCVLVAGWPVAQRFMAPEDLGSAPPIPGVPEATEPDPVAPGVELQGLQDAALDPQRIQGAEPTVRGPFHGPEGPFRIAVRVLDSDTREPLPHYLVVIALSGTKNLDGLPAAQRLVTSDAGECRWPDLARIGPWDLFVGPITFGEAFSMSGRTRRVATVMADPAPGERTGANAPVPGPPLELLVETGPRVTYRGPLPEGVDPKDLRFDLRARVHSYSGHSGNAGGPARGRVGPEGWVTAAMPRLGTTLDGPNFGVRIWTADGNFGLVSVHSGRPNNSTQVVIDEPLRPRAKARFRVELMATREGYAVPTPREIAEALHWEVSGDDPERESLDPPAALLASPSSRGLEQVGPDTFEIGDLAPTTVTFRGWRGGSRLRGLVHPPDGVQAVASHGDPVQAILKLFPVD